MSMLIALSHDLSLLGLLMALVSLSLSLILRASYNKKPATWKNDAYQTMLGFQHIGFAISAIGGAMFVLYIWLELRGAL